VVAGNTKGKWSENPEKVVSAASEKKWGGVDGVGEHTRIELRDLKMLTNER